MYFLFLHNMILLSNQKNQNSIFELEVMHINSNSKCEISQGTTQQHQPLKD